MPCKNLKILLEHDFETLTGWEKFRVASAMVRLSGFRKPLDWVYKHELPLCGVRCRDGHPCQTKAIRDTETGCYVRYGRCRLHGGLITGLKTAVGRRRIAQAAHKRWRQYRQ